MTHRVGEALTQAVEVLRTASRSPRLDAEVLLSHVLGVDRTALLAHPERPLTPEQAAAYRALVARCAAGEPVAYLVGYREFYGLRFHVTPDVLIPRPETEHLVEGALAWARGRAGLQVVDVGAGSGAIAVALAVHLPGATVTAIDNSAAALDVADRCAFVLGDLLAPLRAPVDLIAANLPYVASDAFSLVATFEPRRALDGGPDGLRVIARLLAQAPPLLKDESLLLLEIGYDQADAVTAMARDALPGAQVSVIHDYAGHPRVVRVEKGAPADSQRLVGAGLRPAPTTAAFEADCRNREMLAIDAPDAIARAAEALHGGRLVVLPTDTVYGVAAHPAHPEAVAALYAAKARPPDKAIPILLADPGDVTRVAQPLSDAARRLAAAFWPGPLTLVVPKRADLPEIVSSLPTVGVRVPDHDATRAVIRAAGGALAVTSANRSGAANPVTVSEAAAQLGEAVALYLDGGVCPGGQPSTVAEVGEAGLVIHRAGPISEAALRAAL